MKYISIVFLSFFLLFTYSCLGPDDPAVQRFKRAEQAKGKILVGAVAPWSRVAQLWQGIKLAVEEINSNGGLLGRKIKLIKKDDKASVKRSCRIAQEFVANPDIVAVLGHYESFTTMPASVIYQYNGILLLSTVYTNPALTKRGLDLVFRTVPGYKAYAKKLAEYCRKKNIKNILVYYDRNEYGRSLDLYFEEAAQTKGVKVVGRKPLNGFITSAEFKTRLDHWESVLNFDAILVAGKGPKIRDKILELRQAGFQKTILGGLALDRSSYWQSAEIKFSNIVLPTVFDPYSEAAQMQNFFQAFKNHYNQAPDFLAAEGYDTLRALAFAIKQSGSTSPQLMSQALKSGKTVNGVSASFHFDQQSDWLSQDVFLKEVKNGNLVVINP